MVVFSGQVVTAGKNPKGFKLVGTTGAVGGAVAVANADAPQTRPMGMPMVRRWLSAPRCLRC